MEKSPQKDKKCHSLFKHSSKPVEQKPDCSKQALKRVSDKTVITGGAGYFGFTLGSALAELGTEIILYDRKTPLWEIPKGVELVQADVRNFSDFYNACEGVDCVIHAAAYGMSGSEQVTQLCDEEIKPFAESIFIVSYFTGGGKLYTCALRPPGIYGPEEQRHLPRLALNIERGLFAVRFGDPGALMNWVHVNNLVHAHILAAEALTLEKNYIAGGQAYFINDNEKVNLFEWLSPLVSQRALNYSLKRAILCSLGSFWRNFEGLGVRKPRIRIPVFLVHISVM
ncbi:hypothetical protein JD844_019835 [Phrynosoma platyrhinos]|uniref:3-beta hydroxysteroid dehydrogenase/isomerase domain-containing protein n=1 Tax=Phrynosoma platyrhinos TaxID=52577 RepID=A0ABQ7TR93_PHRPL|nr:hypothetical protein JD844_019835 [Phrynosoma platyrhinos]